MRQLQEHLLPEDTGLHQVINKIIAATEYSADTSLSLTRVLAFTVASRCFFWLRSWKADVKTRWKLASAPYWAPNLFGAALEPILVEDKDKHKVMPSSYHRAERCYPPYSGSPFGHFPPQGGHFAQRQYSHNIPIANSFSTRAVADTPTDGHLGDGIQALS